MSKVTISIEFWFCLKITGNSNPTFWIRDQFIVISCKCRSCWSLLLNVPCHWLEISAHVFGLTTQCTCNFQQFTTWLLSIAQYTKADGFSYYFFLIYIIYMLLAEGSQLCPLGRGCTGIRTTSRLVLQVFSLVVQEEVVSTLLLFCILEAR